MPLNSVWQRRRLAHSRELEPHDSNNQPCKHEHEHLRACIECGNVVCFECDAKITQGPPLYEITEWICHSCMDDATAEFISYGAHEDESGIDDEDDETLDCTDYDGIGEGLTVNEPTCKHCNQIYTDCGCEDFEAKI